LISKSVDAVDVLRVQLTHDLFAVVKFLLIKFDLRAYLPHKIIHSKFRLSRLMVLLPLLLLLLLLLLLYYKMSWIRVLPIT